MERWYDRVTIVTGASAGIGAAIARLLVENGMRVVGVARKSDKIKSLAAKLKGCKGELHAVEGDVTKEEDVVRVVKWTRDNLGGADVLVNNAGVYRSCPFTSLTSEDILLILNTNIVGLCMFTREVIKDMRDRGIDDGHIFHINSLLAHRLIVSREGCVYAASKHAVRVMTEGLRRELRDLNTKIRVTSISPGTVRTNIMLAAGMSTEFVNKRYTECPTLEPKDIAQALLYALSAPPHVQIHEITMQPTGERF